MASLRFRPADPAAELAHGRAELSRLAAALADAKAELEELRTTCHEDSLTGLLNRRGFQAEIARSISFSVRYGIAAALLLLDLDSFKSINDGLGHAAGDTALRHVAEVLRANLRLSDVIGRHGGDEFAILLWQVSEDVATAKALTLEEALSGTVPPGELLPGAVSGSIGVAAIEPGDDPETLFARADAAMYRRKAERRKAERRTAKRREDRPDQAMMSGRIWSSR